MIPMLRVLSRGVVRGKAAFLVLREALYQR